MYNTWKQEDMNEALLKHRNGEIGFNEACRRYNIPKPTLRRHLRGLNNKTKFGRPNDMTAEMEEELAQHIMNLESSFFGLTITEVRKLAYELAEKYQLPHRFNKEKKIAGKKWFYRFMKDHPALSLRVPEATSMARSKGFNRERVNEFFDKYEAILDEHKFTADQIYNMDETALSTVHKPSKVVAQKGKHQVGAITSGERGLTTTGVCAMNAAGEFIPPMLIFKRSRMNDTLKKGAPPNTAFGCSKNGWMTSELFVQWLQHFIKCTRLEKRDQKQILLLLDGHSTHTKNLEAIQLARDYGIVMLSFPAHTTHRLQPLDRSFFKSLKNSYNETASSWLRSNPGSVIKQANVSELLGIAYPRSVRMDIALNGFKATGLWPCDRNVIKEEDFVTSLYIMDQDQESADVTETTTRSSITLPPAKVTSPSRLITPPRSETPPIVSSPPVVASPPTVVMSPSKFASLPRVVKPVSPQPEPSTSHESAPNNNISAVAGSNASLQIKSYLNVLAPIPYTTVIKKMKKGTKPTMELTSSPYKNEIEAKEKINKGKKPVLVLNKKEKGMQKTIKKRKIDETRNKNKKTKVKESWLCHLCKEDRQENMIQCTQCKGWVHDLCAGVESKIKKYTCDICVQSK